ncbi:MAG TPA: glycosyltransferase family 39 protein, partial [Minicystis sp.]|nr:glycosyltransferase family 39 protein [Minicystis sp.]
MSARARLGEAWTEAVRARRGDLLVAWSLAVAYVALLLRTTKDLGYARDEGFYFQASSAYARWFTELWRYPKTALEPRMVDAAWSANHEHPALMKSLFGLSNLVFEKKLHLFAMEGTSFRLPAILLAGALVGLVYLWGASARGRVAGLGAAVLFAAMPRVFFHAHLACFDVPIVALWTATAFAYERTLRKGGALWPALTGVFFGLALDTKHNAWFLPFALGAHAVAIGVYARFVAKRPDAARVRVLRALSALAAMAVLGPLLLYALWPWIWHDTIARLRDYAAFHLHHEYYNMELFHETYWKPPMPRSYAWVMTI